MKFCKSYKKWTYNDWEKTIFSDELKFNLFGSDAGQKTWYIKGSRLDPANINAVKKFGGGNLMVWGCITSKGVGKILRVSNKIKSSEYCNVLFNGFIKTCDMYNYKVSEILYMQDNASCHVSKETKSGFRSIILMLLIGLQTHPT